VMRPPPTLPLTFRVVLASSSLSEIQGIGGRTKEPKWVGQEHQTGRKPSAAREVDGEADDGRTQGINQEAWGLEWGLEETTGFKWRTETDESVK
jgi:hypothetical protein